ncbi:MAG TPA: alpha-L-rhamnosidase, partial [Opitutaceae bacterium]
MRITSTITLCLAFAFQTVLVPGSPTQSPQPAERWLRDSWPAYWITAPGAPTNEYGVYLFRKELELAEVPERFVVHVSADARFRLFVNGTEVAHGPQRSDAWVWRYDSVDLAPLLLPGANAIAAQVWSYGELTPYSVIGVRTGLIVQGDTDAEQSASTDPSWKVARDPSFEPTSTGLRTYIVVGPGDRVSAGAHPWGWKLVGFDDSGWTPARQLTRGNPYGLGTDMDHWLMPRSIPPMERALVRFATVRRSEGVEVPEGFEAGSSPLQFAPNTRASVLFDQGTLTNAYPKLTLSGGRGATVRLSYAEALIDDARTKGNRDEVEGRRLV